MPPSPTRRCARAVACFLLLVAGCRPASEPSPEGGHAPAAREVVLDAFFQGIDPGDATFVLLHGRTGAIVRHNPDRARERFIPASTFKIPNTLIALETGVATGPDYEIRYDSAAHHRQGFWAPVWSRDHTLRTALRNSVYWYYQEIARDVGPERMQQYVDRFAYGNRDLGGGIDRFWLYGDLRISPDEQVRFLRRMYEGRLGLSARTTRIVKDLLLLEETGEYRLGGKTGTADVTPTRELAWLVGYVERGDETWYYALNMEGERVWEQWGPPGRRRELVRALLRELEVL